MTRSRVRKPLSALLMLGLASCGHGNEAPKPVAVRATTAKPSTQDKSAPHTRVASAAAPARAAQPPPGELAQLKSGLVIPVAGVGTMELVDTFEELRGKRKHAAIDILAPRGAAVLSATAGRVLQISTSASGGLMVFATDPTEHFMLLYAHLDSYAKGLSVGMPLRPGQVLGAVGTTGNAPANTPHLHFAIAWAPESLRWSKGVPLDPRPLLVP
ncbi:MAG TPA: M23 family metallopeptidase [Solimonas sp.]|nr:M23 family metallopeptidase [Solimonas sp.]